MDLRLGGQLHPVFSLGSNPRGGAGSRFVGRLGFVVINMGAADRLSDAARTLSSHLGSRVSIMRESLESMLVVF